MYIDIYATRKEHKPEHLKDNSLAHPQHRDNGRGCSKGAGRSCFNRGAKEGLAQEGYGSVAKDDTCLSGEQGLDTHRTEGDKLDSERQPEVPEDDKKGNDV